MIARSDTKGRKSHTLGFVTTAFILICVAFITILVKGNAQEIISSLSPFGIAVGMVLAPILGRDYIKKDE